MLGLFAEQTVANCGWARPLNLIVGLVVTIRIYDYLIDPEYEIRRQKFILFCRQNALKL